MMINNPIETPGRFYEYIGTGKPLLLMIPDSSLKQIATDYKASFISAPKDIGTIIRNLNTIYHL